MRLENFPFELERIGTMQVPVFDSKFVKPEGAVGYKIVQSNPLSDSTEKFLMIDEAQEVNGFLILSSRNAPDMVARSVRRAEAVRSLLPEPQSRCVLLPFETGNHQECSYAIFPVRQPVASGRFRRRWEKFQSRTRILDWLDCAVTSTRMPILDATSINNLTSLLKDVVQDTSYSANMRQVAHQSIVSLETGVWIPYTTIAHNDFWWGNVVFAPPDQSGGFGFQFIDWASSETSGFPVYDLMRMALSLRLSDRVLERRLRAHAAGLDCLVSDCRSYLCLGLANLRRNLEHFPREIYYQMVGNVWKRIQKVLD